jgi:hypothetical protein
MPPDTGTVVAVAVMVVRTPPIEVTICDDDLAEDDVTEVDAADIEARTESANVVSAGKAVRMDGGVRHGRNDTHERQRMSSVASGFHLTMARRGARSASRMDRRCYSLPNPRLWCPTKCH